MTSEKSIEAKNPQLDTNDAQRALEAYVLQHPEDQGLIERANDIRETVAAFASGEIAQKILTEVPFLKDLTAIALTAPIESERRKDAASALSDYFSTHDATSKHTELMQTILGDMVKIEHQSDILHAHFLEKTDDDSTVLRSIFLDDSDHQFSKKEIWTAREPHLEIDELAEIVDGVNIESLIINSVAMLEQLKSLRANTTSNLSDKEILRHITDVESVHAPIMEVVGMSALAMALRSEAFKIRFMNWDTTHMGYVGVAEIMHAEASQKHEQIIRKIFPLENADRVFAMPPLKKTDEAIIYNHSTLDHAEADGNITWRIKSVGSLANKIRRDESGPAWRMPMDLLGATVVFEQISDLAEYYIDTVRSLDTKKDVDYKPAPSKSSPLYIQGSAKYVETFLANVPQKYHQRIQSKIIKDQPEETIYQVAKITFVCDGVPTEVQFLSEADYINGKVGNTAHILHKGKNSRNDTIRDIGKGVQLLSKIHCRRDKVDIEGELMHPPSRENGEMVRRAIGLAI